MQEQPEEIEHIEITDYYSDVKKEPYSDDQARLETGDESMEKEKEKCKICEEKNMNPDYCVHDKIDKK